MSEIDIWRILALAQFGALMALVHGLRTAIKVLKQSKSALDKSMEILENLKYEPPKYFDVITQNEKRQK